MTRPRCITCGNTYPCSCGDDPSGVNALEAEKRAALNAREAEILAADRVRNPQPCECGCPMHRHQHTTSTPGDLTPCGSIEIKLGMCTGCGCLKYKRAVRYDAEQRPIRSSHISIQEVGDTPETIVWVPKP